MNHEPAEGFAVSWIGEIDIKTVSSTRIGSISSWLGLYRRSVFGIVAASAAESTDDQIEQLWIEYGEGAMLVSVIVFKYD